MTLSYPFNPLHLFHPFSPSSMSEPIGGIATLGINLNVFIAQLVNFLVVLLVLWKFAYKPIMKLLDDRSQKIEESLKQSEVIAMRVDALEQERAEVIAQAKSDASQILTLTREEAEKKKLEMVEQAKKEVEKVILLGKDRLKTEKEQMVREAKEELIELAVAGAKKILEESIDEKKSGALAESVIKKMKSYETNS